MELKIYNKSGNLILTASPNTSSSLTEEIGGECSVSASFTHTSFILLDVDSYIEIEGVRYKVKSRYRPKQKDTQTYEYSVKFYAPIHDAEDVLMLFTEGDITSEFNYDGGPREHLQLWIDNMNRLAGTNVWSIGTVISAENKTIEYKNLKCWDAAFGSNGIAATFETEMWADGYVINLCKAERGEIVELGYLQGLTNLAQEDNGEVKFFTRLFPLGSTRNIDASKYGYSRLQLPSRAKYVDKNVDLYGVKEEYEESAFSGIYPKYEGTVSSVRTENKTSEEGRDYTVYYFKDSGMNFNPDDYAIPEYTYKLEFQTGELAGRGTEGSFEAAWHNDTKEWEIVNVYPDDTTQIPGGAIIPKSGDKYIPWNFTLPQEYITAAEQAYKQAVDNYLDSYSFDPNKYTGTTDRNFVERNNTPLKIGWNVRLLSEQYFTGGYKDTRITKVVRKLNDLCQATITCTDQVGTTWKTSVNNQLNNLQYILTKQEQQAIIDIIKTTDSKTASDYNVFSALRSLATFLRKDIPDSTKHLLSLLGGVLIEKSARFGEFITGVSGGMIDENANMEMESGYFRKRLFVPEIAYNRITYFKGRAVISPGGGCKVKSYIKNDDGSFTVTPDLTDADALSQFKDDILSAFFTTKNEEGKLNGFAQMQFRVTEADYDAKTFKMVNKPGESYEPGEEMVLAQTGNFSDEERQTYTLFDTINGNNCITFFDHANTWDPEPAQMPSWFGKKKGMKIAGIDCDNYSAVLQNILMTGLIFQIDEITGDSVRVPIDKGEWIKETNYGYYNRVSHNGALWLCVSEKATKEEPGTGNAWLKQVSEGAQGEPGMSVVGGGHWESSKTPYQANTLVSFYNCVFISNVKTSNPPIAIARYKDGSFIRQKNGGYILAGKSADFTVHPDWTMLLDGRELQGKSITFLGSFDTAPSNPAEGNSYYNTTDKCTYVYQNGVWMLMVSDGKDGRDYEYIYTRNNSIGIIPDKPDSKQQDDYVPEGWTDDFLGVSETFQVEWGCKRTKRDGVWSEWSDPAIVHRWSKDGENAVIADLDNEMVNCALTSDGKVSKAQSWVTNVAIWYGYESLPLESISTTQPSGITVSANKDTGAVTVSVAQNVVLSETNDVVITLTATKNGQNFERNLTFTIAGVRAGENGQDAVLYSLLPSASSIVKYKDGSYDISTISCKRQKTVGGTISDTTEGTLKYSLDGGAEMNISDNSGIATSSIKKSVKFLFYVNDKLVDVETIPLLSDGKDGSDGTSIVAVGHWESSKVPYLKNNLVNFGRGTFVALKDTSNPPLPIARFKDGTYIRMKDGGYILAGKFADMQVNADWQMMSWSDEAETLYWLDCPISAFSLTSTGSASPSSVEVTCKQSKSGNVSSCADLWLAARRYNGSWVAHVSATKSNAIGVPALAGYTQYVVRAYKTQADANAWNSAYVAERGIGVAQAGKDGTDYEYIFQRTTTNSRPSTPSTSQQDDYVPSGWTDDPQGISETYPYEWASMRTKNDKVWGAFCTPYPFCVLGKQGIQGVNGAFPYDRGVYKSGNSYVWNQNRRDKIIYKIGNTYYNFLVKNYGATVTAAPTSASGDSNWEAMQKFESLVTDTFFADGANIAGLMFKLKGYTSAGIPYGEVQSQNTDGHGTPMLYMNTQTGYFHCGIADITGSVTANSGKIGGWNINGNNLECTGFNTKILVEASGTRFMRINAEESVMCYLRSDESTGISVSVYGNTNDAIGLNVLCNSMGKGYAIKSYGNAFLNARQGERVELYGLVVNTRKVSTSVAMQTNDDFIEFNNTSAITFNMSSNSKIGKIIYMKKITAGYNVNLTGDFRDPGSVNVSTTLTIGDEKSRIFLYDGSCWVQFYCG